MRRHLLVLAVIGSVALTAGARPVAWAEAATRAASPAGAVEASNAAAGVSGSAVVQFAMRYLGHPYTAVGNSPSTGFSCIGFVSYVYQSLGVNLPDDLGGAMAFAPAVSFADLEPGDVLFFQNTVWAGLSHTAIYIGGGRFIHAEWYNRGVVISSFTNDPVDFNYWTAHYLGANRPWMGAVSGAVPSPPSIPGQAAPSSGSPAVGGSSISGPASPQVPVQTSTGPAAFVRVPFLNVRSRPSLSASIETVLARGTRVIRLGHRNSWYRVTFAGGDVGWIIGAGIGRGGFRPTSPLRGTTLLTRAAPRPLRRQIRAQSSTRLRVTPRTLRTVAVEVNGLRVHTAPALGASVRGSAYRGQRLAVLRRSGAWIDVRLPAGGTGWISSAYVSSSSVGHARLSRTLVHSAVTTRSGSRQVSRSRASQGQTRFTHTRAAASKSVVTAGVRLHAGPGLNRPVITLVAAGTPVTVLGSSGSWLRVRLSARRTGYIYGLYVRR